MKITEIQRQYAFEITVKEYREILKRDKIASDNAYRVSMANSSQHGYQTLGTVLKSIAEIEKVDYDANFGPYIYVTIQQPCRPDTLEKIEQAIANYVR